MMKLTTSKNYAVVRSLPLQAQLQTSLGKSWSNYIINSCELAQVTLSLIQYNALNLNSLSVLRSKCDGLQSVQHILSRWNRIIGMGNRFAHTDIVLLTTACSSIVKACTKHNNILNNHSDSHVPKANVATLLLTSIEAEKWNTLDQKRDWLIPSNMKVTALILALLPNIFNLKARRQTDS